MIFDRKKFYVTTPLYYPSAKPHVGTLYTTVIADVMNRVYKLGGCETFFLTGTDEHGQKIAQLANAAGLSPKEFVNQMAADFKAVWDVYGIKYNRFIRTTDEDHTRAVQDWIKQLQQQGDIYKGLYTGWYCPSDEAFIAEKEVSPDKPVECTLCGRQTIEVSEECYFFRLAAYQERLLELYRENPNLITPHERFNEVISFVEAGLKDLCISRTTVSWGIPFPGDEKHIIYVWADALNNYITGIGYGNLERVEEFKKWWPADLQIMAKEIIRFHAVYWPAFLMATGLEMPRQLLVHGWIKFGDQKMSKSLGNVVSPLDLAQKYGPESIRYYLIRHLAVTQDSPFSIEDLERRLNADLAHDLGNLLNRMTALATKHGITMVQAPAQLGSAELALRDKLWSVLNDFLIDMEECYVHRAYAHVWKFIGHVNAYFHAQEPWIVAKQDPERFMQIMSAVCNSLYAIGVLVWPVMPQKMEEMLASLGVTLEFGPNLIEKLSVDPWLRAFTLKPIPPLFNQYETMTEEKKSETQPVQTEQQYLTFDEFKKVELCVGTIEECHEVPNSQKLYRLMVNFGPKGTRQILSGVKHDFKPEDLIGKQGVFVCNLAPRTMMGLESQGMMLFVEGNEGKLAMVTVGQQVPNGNPLR